jgi:integrase/recombinase XerD
VDIHQWIDRFANHLVLVSGCSLNTVSAYTADILEFVETAGVASPQGIGNASVTAFIERMRKAGYAAATQARKVSAVKSLVRFLVGEHALRSNPITLRYVPRIPLRLPDTLGVDEVAAILEAPEGDGVLALRDRALLETLYATGMRVSEAVGLKLTDAELDVGFVTCKGKGAKTRTVPLGGKAIEALKRYLAEARGKLAKGSSRYVFLGRKGPLSRQQVFRIIKKYAAAAGVKKRVSPHTLRHSCATHLLENGAGLRVVQELLGHANLSTTEIYTHLTVTDLKATYARCHPHA